MKHGTATDWRHHRSRCDACHAALLDEGRVAWALRKIRAGCDRATRVPIAVARRCLLELESAGFTRVEIAAGAGVLAVTVSRLANPGNAHDQPGTTYDVDRSPEEYVGPCSPAGEERRKGYHAL